MKTQPREPLFTNLYRERKTQGLPTAMVNYVQTVLPRDSLTHKHASICQVLKQKGLKVLNVLC